VASPPQARLGILAPGAKTSAEEFTTGSDIEKAKSVALDHVNGRVIGTKVGDKEDAYKIEVIREDGSQVDVHLDRDFNALSTPADDESPDARTRPTTAEADRSGGL
jgi:hypothetical protein